MHPLIQENRQAITELSRRYRVRSLEVFGSAARGTDFDPTTGDADFFVEFSPSSDGASLRAFVGLQADVSRILGLSVDLAEASAIRNPYIRASVNRSREVVYGA